MARLNLFLISLLAAVVNGLQLQPFGATKQVGLVGSDVPDDDSSIVQPANLEAGRLVKPPAEENSHIVTTSNYQEDDDQIVLFSESEAWLKKNLANKIFGYLARCNFGQNWGGFSEPDF